MSSKRYFSYIRVSTQRQGQTGTSLVEQQAAIERHARMWNLNIIKRFEERETAAKQGRPVFLEMIKSLRQRGADGVIIHKIDRSARNLKDWADLGALIDSGIEVHFANEGLDLNSRGGRLSADIQAVVASDYIRNLREETKKGIYGRLRQGLYPFPAVIGYVDKGAGKPKEPHPVNAPLIRQAFELYATGQWGQIGLLQEMSRRGLRSKHGKPISLGGLSLILHNPFYMGLIKIEKTGEFFSGVHTPIVAKALFDQVQAVLEGKNIRKTARHFFVFRRQIRCAKCRHSFIPERQKGHVYYRCHTPQCRRGTLREEVIETPFLDILENLRFSDEENKMLRAEIYRQEDQFASEVDLREKELKVRLEKARERLSSLTDWAIDQVFDRETYLYKKNELILEEKEILQQLDNNSRTASEVVSEIENILELANSARLSYEIGNDDEKRDLVKSIVSNFEVSDEKVLVRLNLPFQLIAERTPFHSGGPCSDTSRTFADLVNKLYQYFRNSPISKSDDDLANYLTSKLAKTSKPNNYQFIQRWRDSHHGH